MKLLLLSRKETFLAEWMAPNAPVAQVHLYKFPLVQDRYNSMENLTPSVDF